MQKIQRFILLHNIAILFCAFFTQKIAISILSNPYDSIFLPVWPQKSPFE